MVFASYPVRSEIRFAARPVGAAIITFSPFSLYIDIIALRVVVLPVPGPPVRIRSPFERAPAIASRCSFSYLIPVSCSCLSISFS